MGGGQGGGEDNHYELNAYFSFFLSHLHNYPAPTGAPHAIFTPTPIKQLPGVERGKCVCVCLLNINRDYFTIGSGKVLECMAALKHTQGWQVV